MIFIKVFIMKWKGINKIIEVIEIFIEVYVTALDLIA